ncbi:MAG: winged helix-turn-helix domain-containing protein [Nitrososphaeria archaeon]
MKKTNLQMRVGLNYIRFMEYLNWLTYNGLVQKVIDNESELYRLSPKGLEVYHKLIELIKDILKATKF